MPHDMPETEQPPETERERLIAAILDQPIRTDEDYLAMLRTLTEKIVDEVESS